MHASSSNITVTARLPRHATPRRKPNLLLLPEPSTNTSSFHKAHHRSTAQPRAESIVCDFPLDPLALLIALGVTTAGLTCSHINRRDDHPAISSWCSNLFLGSAIHTSERAVVTDDTTLTPVRKLLVHRRSGEQSSKTSLQIPNCKRLAISHRFCGDQCCSRIVGDRCTYSPRLTRRQVVGFGLAARAGPGALMFDRLNNRETLAASRRGDEVSVTASRWMAG